MPIVTLKPTGYFLARAQRAAIAGVTESLHVLEASSRGEIPVDEGDLRDSLRVDEPTVAGSMVFGKVIAGEGLDYAVIVHEKHPNAGTKFLQRPLIAHTLLHQAILARHGKRWF